MHATEVGVIRTLRYILCRYRLLLTIAVTLIGCVSISFSLHEPKQRIHDEFSYLLLGETLSYGHVSNQAPPLPEFFDTFHVLVRPVYASKYFPAQGIFL